MIGRGKQRGLLLLIRIELFDGFEVAWLLFRDLCANCNFWGFFLGGRGVEFFWSFSSGDLALSFCLVFSTGFGAGLFSRF